ncbi:hypothetical protein L1887_47356 [Cichorium endivia]|nr:hypothetical protein L1887_47356 [Cichorium endivia]
MVVVRVIAYRPDENRLDDALGADRAHTVARKRTSSGPYAGRFAVAADTAEGEDLGLLADSLWLNSVFAMSSASPISGKNPSAKPCRYFQTPITSESGIRGDFFEKASRERELNDAERQRLDYLQERAAVLQLAFMTGFVSIMATESCLPASVVLDALEPLVV